jgi:Family of unknown function (DUF5681)
MAFKKGESGNPKGKPSGLTTATKIRAAIQDSLPGILETVVKAAENGDMAACKLVMDRVCPTLKPLSAPINIPLPTDGGLAEMGGEILKATLTGGISPDIGSMLITALASQAKIIEVDELTKRIELLEAQK